MKKDDNPLNAGSGNPPAPVDIKSPMGPPPEKDPDAPPGYQAEAMGPPPDLAASFAKLDLHREERKPTPDQCIAHLKLLEAIAQLREDVGSTDGLYGLFDHLADGADEPDKVKGKIREKRWAVYVVQAAQRFERWFQSIEKSDRMMTLQIMESEQYNEIHKVSRALEFHKNSLPPLDVLMVWHTFILNPRKFLSDCIRHNKIGLWRAGMPWAPVVDSIDNNNFNYNPGEAAQQHFKNATGLEWDALNAAPAAHIACPRCHKMLVTELTTCITPEHWRNHKTAGEGGQGYADKDFCHVCPCNLEVNHDVLRAQRFRRDLQQLLVHHVPMAGTLLSLDGLTPSAVSHGMRAESRMNSTFRMSYPNRLLLSGAGARIADVTQLVQGGDRTDLKNILSVADIRKVLEDCMRDKTMLAKASITGRTPTMLREERIGIRRMMSCYWDDASIFSIDLAGAVVRQNVFVQKMHDIDWLHSPAVRSTMERLINKYVNFFQIMKMHPKDVAVPTLDVDLAWHTHQLAPPSYRDYSVTQTGIFIDHDDKIDENKLSTSFEWTSKTYEKMFNAVYSECTCWYCEAIREAHTSKMSRLFKSSKKDPVASDLDRLHSSDPSNPHLSPHISAHNAIKSKSNPDTRTAVYVKQQQLERNYQKAVQRAKKEGRPPPERDAFYYYPYWGFYYPMPFYAPYMGDPCINGGMYPANPGCANFGAGAVGNCCAGACGGNVAMGGCAGGAASCGGSGVGGGCGGGGGGFGGCGGGGGGGCGGGGGGGGCGGGGGG